MEKVKFFSGQNTAAQKYKTLYTALRIACEPIEQLRKSEECSDVKYLKEFELQLQRTLKHLIQVLITKNSDANALTNLKQIYSSTLQSDVKRDNFASFSGHILNNLIRIQNYIQEYH